MSDLKNDFESFVSDREKASAGSSVLSKIHAQIEKERPSYWTVAGKIGLAHVAGSLITLSACSQFGVKLFFKEHDLMFFFMHISETFCQTFCGGFYLALTFIIARLMLGREEWILLLKNRVLAISSLALVSLVGFSLMTHNVSFEAGLLWVFGAALGAEAITFVKPPRLAKA